MKKGQREGGVNRLRVIAYKDIESHLLRDTEKKGGEE